MILPTQRMNVRARSLLILLLLLLAQPLYANSYTWSGATSGNWSDQSQWLKDGTTANQGVPGAADTAIVLAGQVNEVTVARTVTNLTIGGSGIVNFTTVGLTITGTFTQTGGSLNGSGPTTITGTGSVTLAGGAINTTGLVSIAGSLTWTGGSMTNSGTTTITSTGTFSLSPGVNITLSQRTLNNTGSCTWTGAALFIMSGGAVFNNNSSIDNQANTTWQFSNGVFNNNGTFKKTSGGGTSRFNESGGTGNFINNGSVLIQNGTVLIATSNGTSTGGSSYTVEATMQLTFGGTGTHLFNATCTISGAGLLNFGGTTATVNCAVNVGAMIVSAGTANLNAATNDIGQLGVTGSGTLGGTGVVNANTAFTFAGNAKMQGNGQTIVNGTALLSPTTALTISQRALFLKSFSTWQQTGPITLDNNATMTNDGVLDSQSDGTLRFNAPLGGTFNNNGTFKKSSGTGLTHISDNTAAGLFNTFGDVQALAGTLDFSTTFTQFSGFTLLNGGSLQANPLTLQGGSLTGAGSVNGSVDNQSGIVEPGGSLAAGAISITNSYTQGSGGNLFIELGGTTPGTQFDRLNIGNNATLNGGLSVSLINGFSPTPAMSFTCMSYNAFTGGFLYSAGGTQLQPQYNQRDLTLIYAPITIVFFDGPVESDSKTWDLPGSQLDKVLFSLDNGLHVNVKNKGAYPVKVHVSILNGDPWVSEEKGRFSPAKDLYYITLLGDHPPPDVDLPGAFSLGTGGANPNFRNGSLEMRTPRTSSTITPDAITLRFVAAYD